MTDYLDVGTRAWTEHEPAGAPRGTTQRPTHAVVFDTETRTIAGQPLMFGTYGYCRIDYTADGTVVTPTLAGIFYADDLAETDPDGYAALREYAHDVQPDFIGTVDGYASVPVFEFVNASTFSRRWIYQSCYEGVGPDGPAMLVAFNMPFDLSRLAIGAGAARSPRKRPGASAGRGGGFFGGFSLQMWQTASGHEGRYPRLHVLHIDAKRARIAFAPSSFTNPETGKKVTNNFRGHFLDLRTLVFGLTDAATSLRKACIDFDVTHGKGEAEGYGTVTPEFIDYAVRDTVATVGLLQATLTEFYRHPVEIAPWQVFSPASLSKAYLRAMGVTPLLSRGDVDHVLHGRAMSGYVGGRAEARITQTPVPIALLDATSMYPTVNTLMGLWQGHVHERIDVLDVTAEVRERVAGFTVEHALDPRMWSTLACLVEVIPNGATIPVRATYGQGGTYNVGVNSLDDAQSRWAPLADVYAACLLGAARPIVVSAIRLVPAGDLLGGLTPVELRGVVPVDPGADDFYRVLVEERQRLKKPDPSTAAGLKTIGNAGSYGIHAQFNVRDLPIGTAESHVVYAGGDGVEHRVAKPEQPGEFCYPPYAAFITAGARLLLAAIERLVTDSGGSYAFMDTDSIAIVASRGGGVVPADPTITALTYAEVDAIAARFDALNPYDRDLVPHLWKAESGDGEYTVVISAKRYARFRYRNGEDPDSGIEVVDLVDRTEDDDSDSDYSAAAPRYPATAPPDQQWALTKVTEHGLGYLQSPLPRRAGESAAQYAVRRGTWILEAWNWVIARVHGREVSGPDWFAYPTVLPISVTSPQIWNRFAAFNADRAWNEQIRPFGFALVITGRSSSGPVTLLAPYEDDPAKWADLDWWPLSGALEPHRLETSNEALPHGPDSHRDADGKVHVVVNSYGQSLAEFAVHPEAKSADVYGRADRFSRGKLTRRTVTPAVRSVIGKEGYKIDEQTAGLIDTDRGIATIYSRTEARPLYAVVREVLADHPAATVLGLLPDGAALSPDQLARFLRSRSTMPPRTGADALLFIAATLAAEALDDPRLREQASYRPEAVLQAWSRADRTTDHLCACGCGVSPTSVRARYATSACRVRAHRMRALRSTEHRSSPRRIS